MKHFIVTASHRLITLLVAFNLVNPGLTSLWGGSQHSSLDDNQILHYQLEMGTGQYEQNTQISHESNIEWSKLGHDSRDLLYRTPGGPVETGTSVTLRLRAASGDLTAAQVRIFNDRQNTLSILEMELVADDGTYEWWQVTLQPSSVATVYLYRFIVIDGSDVDYYADDSTLLGGWGAPSDEEIDNCWQLTIYDPSFQTPDWVKNAIIYQIFPDRFRDGNSSNNKPVGSFYYGEATSIFRSNTNYWNQALCDPLDLDGVCPGINGQNFYGGDLQGVINRLDYLQGLGIAAIYFNPLFKSPSNHGYDTTNYQVIDTRLGDNTLLINLVNQAAAHGISVILDGVFNQTSSDSVYFDLYQRYGGDGACESLSSYYRSWFYFYDVAPGSGPCIGSDGTENSSDYISWLGNSNLPILNSSSRKVREQFWAEGTTPIAPYWLSITGASGWRLDRGGEIDPGILINPANDYWEGFRSAIHEVNPSAYIVGEEWSNPTSWTLGSEWDAGTNYQLSTAILGFWRDEPFIDNDHNQESVLGPIEPLLPSQFNERLLDMQERYAPEAFAAMMNLLDSHDTNRALFMLDHNTDLNNTNIYRDPNYDWSDAVNRLRGAVLLQMTLPGAPVIYYGDEVGLVGPATYDIETNTWQDDPYNRQPYPWLDQSGTPFYTHLQVQSSQDELRNYYTLLTTTRNNHPALRTGSFDPILVDDANMIYAFGRRLPDQDDAAMVILNRSTQNKSVTLDVNGYLPATSYWADILHNSTLYNISSEGTLTLPEVPAMSGMLLVKISGNINPPTIPTSLTATENENQVYLAWSEVPDVDYQIFRSLVPGGLYEQIGTTNETHFTDTSVTNGVQYYYVVRSVTRLRKVVSEFSNEAAALPAWEIDWATLQSPAEISHTIGLIPTENYVGQAYIEGATHLTGVTPGLVAQIGYGPSNVLPDAWSSWMNSPFDMDAGESDQFASPLLPEFTGDFQVVYRYSTTYGGEWIYADLNGPFSGTPINPAIIHVLPSDDNDPPAAPANLTMVDWGDHFVSMVWDPLPTDPTLYACDIYRSTDTNDPGAVIARVPYSTNMYIDEQVSSNVTYYYRVQAVDSSFNRSTFSNQITAIPLTRQISVTFNVDVPNFTTGDVYITGDHPKLGSWDPGKVPMTQVDTNTWTITLDFQEGVILEYKFTRGNYAWLDVEKAADGNTDIPNRMLLVDTEASGTLEVNSTVANWRDPLVTNSYPSSHETQVPINPVVTVTWNQAMAEATAFTLTGPSGNVPGSYDYDALTWTVSFIPNEYLQLDSQYTLSAAYQTDIAGDPQLANTSITFTTIESITLHTIALPIIRR